MWISFNNIVQDSISKHIPTKIRKSGDKKKTGPIYMNRQTIKAVKKNIKVGKSIDKVENISIISITVETEIMHQRMQKCKKRL